MINTSTGTMTHLHKLAKEIGERPAGSDSHQQAAAYLRSVLRETDLAIEEVVVDFPNWSCAECALILEGEKLDVEANPFSPPCEVSAPVVSVGTVAELERADLSDRVVLLYGELSSAPLFPMGFTIYNPDRDRTINRLLLEKRPLAILTTNPQPARRVHIIEDPDMPIPSATIAARAGLALLQRAAATVQLRIAAHMQPGKAVTFVARQPRMNRLRLAICAHYDSKVGTPGAWDNGSGTGALLTLVERLAGRRLSVDLEFIFWADEEYGGKTDQAYAANNDSSDMLSLINMDGIGQVTATNTITMLAQSDSFQRKVEEVTRNYPGLAWVAPWYASNHYTFFAQGVPCIVFGAIGTNVHHQPVDVLDWMSSSKLEEVVSVVEAIVEHIQHVPPEQARLNA